MVTISSDHYFEYQEVRFGRLEFSKHAFERFESRVLGQRSSKSFEDLQEMVKSVLDGCQLVKYKGDFAFYHSADRLVFVTDEYSTSTNDVIYIATVIKDVSKSKVNYRNGEVSFENGKYELILDNEE